MEGPRRKAATEAIKTAREFGDLSENFEYHAAKNEQGLLEARIRALRERLQSRGHGRARHRRARRRGLDRRDRGPRTATTMEVEISAVGGVSPDSPLGAALMGAAVGDEVEVEAPSGSWKARVLAIRAG